MPILAEVGSSELLTGLTTLLSIFIITLYLVLRNRQPPKTLVPNEKVSLKLISREEISHDTRLLRFALPSKDHVLGLPTGNHISLIATINEEMVIRSYTPVSSDDDVGFMDLVVKIYFKNVHPKFPAGGKMTQHLEAMKVGDSIDVRGPKGRIHYLGDGKYEVKKKDEVGRILGHKIGMIAGGSGITPMLQVASEILKNPNDRSQIFLLYANQTPEDILCKDIIARMEKDARFKVWYTVDRAPPTGWDYSVGFVDKEMLARRMPAPGPNTAIMMCGPPPMIKFACLPNLEALGFDEKELMVF